MRNRMSGFTLLEMIVVLVIIGLIMGLVGPALFGQADKAKVQKLRADGEAAHNAGKHDESMKLLAEAKKTLGI